MQKTMATFPTPRWLPVVLVCLALVRAAAGGDAWPPRRWTAYGPILPHTHGQGALPDPHALLPKSVLREIPDRFTIGQDTLVARPVVFEDHRLDLASIFDGVVRGKMVVLSAVHESPEAMRRRLGASADWFMQWWLNGDPVYSTLDTGNRSSRFAVNDHTFELDLKAGRNVLTVAVLSGSSDFFLVIGDPGEMDRAKEYYQQERFEEAAALFADLIRIPDAARELRFEAHLLLGASLLALDRSSEAVEAYRGVFEIPGAPGHYHSRAWLEIGAAQAAAEKTREALSAFRQVVDMPAIPLRHRSLARHHIQSLEGAVK